MSYVNIKYQYEDTKEIKLKILRFFGHMFRVGIKTKISDSVAQFC